MFEDAEEIKKEGGEKELHFYYNREERLKNAPQNVKDYYEGKMKPVRGFRVLFANKQNRFMLLTLVIVIAFAWIYTGLNNSRSGTNINGILFDAQAFRYEDDIYVNIKAQNKKALQNATPFPVLAEVRGINSDGEVSYKEELTIVYDYGEKYLRTKFADYDIIRVDVTVNAAGIEKELTAFIKH
ncbi:MAG: hypothetical protein K6A43_07015 [Treponema sp.]|nr:hypothetical protein [Treponema sp.]